MLDKPDHDALLARLSSLEVQERKAAENVIRAETVVESATSALRQAQATLLSEHGVSSVAAAKEALDALEADLAREIAALEAALRE